MTTDHTTPVVVSAVRTPVGKFLGGLSPLPATRLGALVINEAVRRAGVDAAAIHDGLWDSFSNSHMGNLAEYTAKKAGVSRAEQDRFALESHQKAVAAMSACHFKAETVAVEIPGKKGPTVIDKDEGPRPDTTLEALAALKPAFEKDGTVTPGNAPGLNDGASALVVTSLAFAKAHGLKPLAKV